MAFSIEVSQQFQQDYRNFCSKNASFKKAVDNKISQICELLELNPDHYKPLRGELAGIRRVHIESSFVLLFEIPKNEKTVRLLRLEHHDKVYKI